MSTVDPNSNFIRNCVPEKLLEGSPISGSFLHQLTIILGIGKEGRKFSFSDQLRSFYVCPAQPTKRNYSRSYLT